MQDFIITTLVTFFITIATIRFRCYFTTLKLKQLLQLTSLPIMVDKIKFMHNFVVSTIQFFIKKNQPDHCKEADVLGRYLRQNTAIGRFALQSETETNPSVFSFFVCINHERGHAPTLNEFKFMWKTRVLDKHNRFQSRVCAWDEHFFDVRPIKYDECIFHAPHPRQKGKELRRCIEQMLTEKLDVTEKLWEVRVSTGKLGESGTLSETKVDDLLKVWPTLIEETIFLFRAHHILGDGFSMSIALGDACDEALELRVNLESAMNYAKQSKSTSLLSAIGHFFFYFVIGSLWALSYQIWLMITSSNPFDEIILKSKISSGTRSTSWRVIDEVDKVNRIAKSVASQATINDVLVSCVTSAIYKQLIHHRRSLAVTIPSHTNIVIPVHLPTSSKIFEMRNRIGGFVAKVPLPSNSSNLACSSRLKDISKSLLLWKATPAPLISWAMARFCSDFLPENMAKTAILKGNARATVVITNIKGFPFEVHWMGRPVTFLSAFLPLPPGIPIGIVVQSYNGELSFTVNADKRAVPNADLFSSWMLDEYTSLKQESIKNLVH